MRVPRHSIVQLVHRTAYFLLLPLLGLVSPSLADEASALGEAEATSGYHLPDQTLVDLIDRPLTPGSSLSPDRQRILLFEQPPLPGIAELAEPELRLAGLRIKPGNNGPSRRRGYRSLAILDIASGESRPVAGLPSGARLGNFTWSPNGRYAAFSHTHGEGIELWVADMETAKARRLSSRLLSLTASNSPSWLSDSSGLICTLVPERRGEAPREPTTPKGPVVQENLGQTTPARTFQDLLKNAHDEALFAYYLTSQLARIGLDGGVREIGEPAIVWDFDPSPDARFLLVETLHRPFSYLVPAGRFPMLSQVWDLSGKVVTTLHDRPLQESIPTAFGSVAQGPRGYEWRGDADATLFWAEALDGGDASREAEERDRLFLLEAPFTGEPQILGTTKLRFGGIGWGNSELAMVTEFFWKTRQVRVSRLRPDVPGASPELLQERSWEDRYNDPGQPLFRRDSRGQPLLETSKDGRSLFLVGQGASPEGNRPFFDVYDLESKKTQRLFRSEAPYFESPLSRLDDGRILTQREAVDKQPNFFVRTLGENGGTRQLTSFPHPSPELLGLKKELIRYTRNDGVQLTATLYLPPGYQASQGPVPTLMWAYPQEFKSAANAGQVTDSPYRFDRIGWWSSVLWLTQGYAVLDDPSMPIVGEEDEEPNDTFIEQLVASAEAAVDEVVRRGISKRGHIAIGGHSYGAFMTANLLAHSDLFATGIARSGAYNRTLTPFGFQAEERSFWEAPEIYFQMSPFMHADKINEPILLIHGEADNNSGTFPMQSERFYSALKGHGATTRLVMLPFESHGYRARESILHMLWETQRWLDSYIAIPREEAAPARVEEIRTDKGAP